MLFIHWDHQWRHLMDIFIVILTIVRGCVRSQYCDGRAKRVKQVELFVKTKLRKRCHIYLIMLCCCRMSPEQMTENMASVSGPFIKCNSRETIKRDACPSPV